MGRPTAALKSSGSTVSGAAKGAVTCSRRSSYLPFWEFGVRPGAPVQPYSIRDDAYLLFLGNEVYLLACPKRCDPAAVFPVNQN
ncbi:hypothetical protein ACWEV9_06945 [Streptomyces albogriseolus]|uniref:hypothetical protein n=1 Tax=Streptomyces albogriseolus TaxID=1887 RepID=UPI0034600010